MTRHMFAGASSPIGFVDFFDDIMPLQHARKRYYLKGSSGSGKSTFMKKVAKKLDEMGFDVDLFHCANDSESLDALAVTEQGFCIIDATAPHSRDPQIPAAVDEIIDFAQFIVQDKINLHKDEIMNLMNCKKIINEKAADYFAAIGKIYQAERATKQAAVNKKALRKLTNFWFDYLTAHSKQNSLGEDRKFFLSAVTPDGLISYVDDFFDAFGYRVFRLFSEEEVGASIFLESIKSKANSIGLSTESCYNPFAPRQIEHLSLPQIKTAFVTADGIFGYRGNADETIDFSNCIVTSVLCDLKNDIEHNREMFDIILSETVRLMKESRKQHAKIEELFVDAMDFERADKKTDEFINNISVLFNK